MKPETKDRLRVLRVKLGRLLSWPTDIATRILDRMKLRFMSKDRATESIIGSMSQEDLLALKASMEISNTIHRIAIVKGIPVETVELYWALIAILGNRVSKYPVLTNELCVVLDHVTEDNVDKIPDQVLNVAVKHGIISLHDRDRALRLMNVSPVVRQPEVSDDNS